MAYDPNIDRRLGKLAPYRKDDFVCGLIFGNRECPCRLCENERLARSPAAHEMCTSAQDGHQTQPTTTDIDPQEPTHDTYRAYKTLLANDPDKRQT